MLKYYKIIFLNCDFEDSLRYAKMLTSYKKEYKTDYTRIKF